MAIHCRAAKNSLRGTSMLFKELIFKSEIHNRTNFILKTFENVVTGYFFRNNRSDSFQQRSCYNYITETVLGIHPVLELNC
jgi:hypothetical protein